MKVVFTKEQIRDIVLSGRGGKTNKLKEGAKPLGNVSTQSLITALTNLDKRNGDKSEDTEIEDMNAHVLAIQFLANLPINAYRRETDWQLGKQGSIVLIIAESQTPYPTAQLSDELLSAN